MEPIKRREPGAMAKIAYIRVSTEDQNTMRQDNMFRECDKVFTDKASGKSTENRPALEEMISYIREGDTVTVESISRLARNTVDLLSIVDTINSKGAQLVILKEGIDTKTDVGRFMLTVFGAMAQLERDYIKSRQRQGIEAHKAKDQENKAQGKAPETYKGRQPIHVDDDTMRKECQAWRAGKQTAIDTMKKMNLKPNTFYRRVKEMGL